MLPRLHVVTDDRVLARTGFVEQAARLLASGGPLVAFHLRGPGTPARTLFDLGTVLRQRARDAGAPFFINDRVDIALAHGADGVQLGQRSITAGQARRLLGGGWIGSSVHSGEEAAAAEADGADFLMLGAIHATQTHPAAPPVGLEALRRMVQRLSIPVLGIGGITADRLPALLNAGAYGAAMISGLWDAPDPAAMLRRCVEAMQGAPV